MQNINIVPHVLKLQSDVNDTCVSKLKPIKENHLPPISFLSMLIEDLQHSQMEILYNYVKERLQTEVGI